MCGSDHPGEAGNAARLADKLVRSAGLTWPDVISPALAPSEPPPVRDPWQAVLINWPQHWRMAVQLCQRSDVPLPGKSRDFLRQIASYDHQPSLKQLGWLRSIVDQCRTGYAP